MANHTLILPINDWGNLGHYKFDMVEAVLEAIATGDGRILDDTIETIVRGASSCDLQYIDMLRFELRAVSDYLYVNLKAIVDRLSVQCIFELLNDVIISTFDNDSIVVKCIGGRYKQWK